VEGKGLIAVARESQTMGKSASLFFLSRLAQGFIRDFPFNPLFMGLNWLVQIA
jgi:hypothetical protein